MKSYNIRRFLTQGFIVLLLVNVAQLLTTEPDLNLTSEVPFRLSGRIVNGVEATLNQFPHLVSLRNTLTMSHFCGGNIIDAEWILTAAHCMFHINGVQRQPWEITIVAGDLWINKTSATHQRSVTSQIIIHENYNRRTLQNDIALLRLSSNLSLTNYAVQYQVLRRIHVPVGTMCQIAGWGSPAHDVDEGTNELMYVNVPIISQTRCIRLYVNHARITSGMICAGYREGLKDACQGDSGGGLICSGQLTGLVSFGEGCAWPNFPGVYADVRFYRNWVLRNTGIDDKAGANSIRLSYWVKLISFSFIGLVTRNH